MEAIGPSPIHKDCEALKSVLLPFVCLLLRVKVPVIHPSLTLAGNVSDGLGRRKKAGHVRWTDFHGGGRLP